MDNHSNNDFKKLQDKWYKKAGFKPEISEYSVESGDGRYFYNEYGHQKFAAKQRYFELAGQFAYDYTFKNPSDKKIWFLHSEGKTIRQVAEILNLSKSLVHRTIKNLKDEMIKQHTKEDDSE